MTRGQLEHLIRAAAAVLGEDGVIIIGSQAIHASVEDKLLPAAATESIEAGASGTATVPTESSLETHTPGGRAAG